MVGGLLAEEVFSPPCESGEARVLGLDENLVKNRAEAVEDDFRPFSPSKKFRALSSVPEPPQGHTDFVLDINAPLVTVPASLAFQLRPYQKEGVHFLYRRWCEHLGSILGDDMVRVKDCSVSFVTGGRQGLGKTIQVVALVAALIRGCAGRFLVLCPLSCCEQWVAELKKWGGLRSSHYNGNVHAKKAAMANLISGRVDVLVTSYETYVQDVEVFATYDWAAVVFDELHRLKSSRTKLYASCMKFICKRRIGLTGTLMQNNLKELFAVVHFIQAGCFGTSQNFEANFVGPIKKGLRRDATAVELAQSKLASEALHNRLCVGSPPGGAVYLRRDKSLIAHTLPKKEDSILFCAMSPMQIDVYARVLQLPEFLLLKESVENCGLHGVPRRQCCLASRSEELRATMLRAIGSLRKVANSLVRVMDNADLAANALDPNMQVQIKRMHLEHNLDLSGKMRVLEQLLHEWHEEGSKVLIFSQSTKMLDILGRFLSHLDFQFCRLDGSIAGDKRQAIIETFCKSLSKFVFLISTKTGGTGLNLCAANVVVIFDPDWNGSNDAQAADRVYRIGQTRDTKIFRLIAAGTIEESMYMRQVYKVQLGNAAIYRSDEKRLFVEDELFGLASLLQHNETSSRTAEILEKSAKRYEVAKSELADAAGAQKGLLEAIFDRDFEALNEDMLAVEDEDESKAHSALAGVLYSHSTTKLLGDDQGEKVLKFALAERLHEWVSAKTIAERQREHDPETFKRQREAFLQARQHEKK